MINLNRFSHENKISELSIIVDSYVSCDLIEQVCFYKIVVMHLVIKVQDSLKDVCGIIIKKDAFNVLTDVINSPSLIHSLTRCYI